MNLRRFCSLLLLTLLSSTLVLARPDAKKPVSYPSPPWHLIDIWWDIGRETPFESYSLDVTISDDVPDSARLYIAPIGLGQLNKIDFYGGLQTRADGNTKSNTTLREIGRGLIFSMWGERSTDAIRPSLGGYFQSSGHEGDFVSVRRPYAWKKGTYTYKLVRMDAEEVGGKPHTWVGAFLYSHEKDENVFIGALRFKSKDLVLAPKIASFVEIYGPKIPVSEIPKLKVTLGNLKVNGKAIGKPGASAHYDAGIPDYADAVGKERAVEITVGQPVEGRKEREVQFQLIR